MHLRTSLPFGSDHIPLSKRGRPRVTESSRTSDIYVSLEADPRGVRSRSAIATQNAPVPKTFATHRQIVFSEDCHWIMVRLARFTCIVILCCLENLWSRTLLGGQFLGGLNFNSFTNNSSGGCDDVVVASSTETAQVECAA